MNDSIGRSIVHVVVVSFNVLEEHVNEFKDALLSQANKSLALEKDCIQFDVCYDPDDELSFYLYEIYRDENAFHRHLKSDHFQSFNATVSSWVSSKRIKQWINIGI